MEYLLAASVGVAQRNKELVVIAVEMYAPGGLGRIRMKRMDDASANSLSEICFRSR